jgi:hypothetical protein
MLLEQKIKQREKRNDVTRTKEEIERKSNVTGTEE